MRRQYSYHYYAFGSFMGGRQYNSTNYRFGFNGKEKDDEVSGSGNKLDFGARIYDSRLGRFLTLDPLSKQFPEESNYSYAGNSTLLFIDKNGEKKTIYLTIIHKDGHKTELVLVDQKDVRLKHTNSYLGPTLPYSADVTQTLVIDVKNMSRKFGEELFSKSDQNYFIEKTKQAADKVDKFVKGKGGIHEGGFRIVSVNGENIGDDPTKMKISPENARDLQSLNMDDIAVILSATGTKGKSLNPSSAGEALSDISNNIKEIVESAQDQYPSSAYQQNKAEIEEKNKQQPVECRGCEMKTTVEKVDSVQEADNGRHNFKKVED